MLQKRTVQLKSFAKLNLALNILGVENGYHMLDSIVTSVNLYDFIQLTTRTDREICVTMHGKSAKYIPTERNNAYKAAQSFMDSFQTTGADIDIYKNIPVGAGLGGSSADCAGVLNAMAAAYGVKDRQKLKALADTLGSDTGYMLDGGLARLKGRGENVQKLYMRGKLFFLLLFPKGSVNTAKCYAAFDKLPQTEQERRTDIDKLARSLKYRKLDIAIPLMYNALQKPAVSINANIQKALDICKKAGGQQVLVTGSGSCVYAVFTNYQACKAVAKKCYMLAHKIVIPIQKGYQQLEDKEQKE